LSRRGSLVLNNIDYKIFVPRGENNYVRFDEEEIEITEILTVNIHIGDDKVTYWIYLKIPEDDKHHTALLKNVRTLGMVLLIGNNPYEIRGAAEIVTMDFHVWERKWEAKISFTVTNASKTVNNPRKENKADRFEMLDLRKDE